MQATPRAATAGLVWLVLATILTIPAAAQGGGSFPPGPIYLTEGIEVKAGERLYVGPGTSVTGPGNITVWGELVVNGTEGSPAEFSVQIRVLQGGRADLHQARLWGLGTTALEIFGGDVTLRASLVEANARAALVTGGSRFRASDTLFRDHTGEALYVEGSADVSLDGVTVSANGRGATIYSAERFHANNTTFLANGQHLVVDLGPWSIGAADISLERSRFGAPAPTPAELPGILLRHDPPLVSEESRRTIRMDSNRIEGAPVGLRAEGRGLVLASVNDTFVDNAIGVSVQLATVDLVGATLGNDRDVAGSGRVTLQDVTYLRGGSIDVVDPDAAGASWPLYALGAFVALALGGGIVAWRVRRPAPPRAEPLATAPTAPEPAPPAPDLATPLSAIERRILQDILANPGTAQRAIADRLGYTRQALHYHVKKLEARGLVTKRVDGRETRCDVSPGVASMLAPSE